MINNLSINLIISSIFSAGMWCFISGQFILSSVLFCSATIYSNTVNRVNLDR
ncbi:MAG: hypothetical protein RIQ94_1008 [Pseudomonadota bacterium]